MERCSYLLTVFVLVVSFSLSGCSKTTATRGASSVENATSKSTQLDLLVDEEAEEILVQQLVPGATSTASVEGLSDVAARYTVHKEVISSPEPTIPPVLLSDAHAKLCKVNVGDLMPKVKLPNMKGKPTELSSQFGKKATVVLFWHPDRWMARTALTDMQRDIAQQFKAELVSVVGIAVEQPRGRVQAALNKAQASFQQLLDSNGAAFGSVGAIALPRIYVLDAEGKIAWFDIEYSEGTRRELWQTLRVLTSK